MKSTLAKQNRPNQQQDTVYIQSVLVELQLHPHKMEILQQNCLHYKTQIHLKRGFLRAIERLEWVIQASKNPEEFAQAVLAEDYIGDVIRRYPLLFKGIITAP